MLLTCVRAADQERLKQAYPSGALAYFNGGPESGASQPHKHVQVVPLPLGGGGSQELPFEAAATAAAREAGSIPLEAAEMRNMPFQSYCTLLPDRCGDLIYLSLFMSTAFCNPSYS